jgi:subtilisin family serine protease
MSPYGGVPYGREGLILQRGGEELVVLKAGDRFTVRLQGTLPTDVIWAMLKFRKRREIPGTNLVEIQVPAEQLEASMARARQHEAIAFASHVYLLPNNSDSPVYLTDEVTVQGLPQVGMDRLQSLLRAVGLSLDRPVAGLENTFVCRVSKTATANPVKLANQLLAKAEIQMAEANVVIRSQPHYRPRDSMYPQQWYLFHQGGANLAANSHIDVEQAWEVTRGDRSIVIAVADDAIDLTHPDLQGPGKIVAPRDLHDKDFSPLPVDKEDNHGTAVAGLALAEENGQGIVGVAPGCALMPIRTTGFLDDSSVEDVFNWAINNGAAVICCSWGAGAVKFPLSLRQRAALTRAATQGRNGKGCAIVFAAGNFNRPLNSTVEEQGWPKKVLQGVTAWLNGFTVHPDVITVAACTSLNQKAAYSNWGNEIFISAPSNNAAPAIWLEQTGYIQVPPQITSSLPGAGMVATDRSGIAGYESGDYTTHFGGTSSACPLVAGTIALMLSANPLLSLTEVKRLLQQSADKIVDRTIDAQFGAGFGTYEANGHSKWFGYGKVNAARAVQAARQGISPTSEPGRLVQGEVVVPVAIADRAVTRSAIAVTDLGLVKSITVILALDHGYLGDLELSLVSPNQTAILLQNRTLGRRTSLEATYDLESTPLLRQLIQKPSQGLWQLQIRDLGVGHTGTLKRWTLRLGL